MISGLESPLTHLKSVMSLFQAQENVVRLSFNEVKVGRARQERLFPMAMTFQVAPRLLCIRIGDFIVVIRQQLHP